MTNSRAVLLLLAAAVVASITAAPILGEVAEIGAEDVPTTPAEQDSKAPKETVKSILASHGMPTGAKDTSNGDDAKSDARKTEGTKGDTNDAKTAAPVKDDAAPKDSTSRKDDAKANSAAPKDNTKADAKAPKDDAKADSVVPKDDAKAPLHNAKADSAAPKEDAKVPKTDAKADTAAPKDDAKADTKGPKDNTKADSAAAKDDAKAPKDDAKADTAAPKEDAKADSKAPKADAKAPKNDAEADTAAPKDDAKTNAKAPKDDAEADSAAPKDDAKAETKAPKDNAKADSAASKDDAQADATPPKDDAKADSAASKDDAKDDAKVPKTDAKAGSATPKDNAKPDSAARKEDTKAAPKEDAKVPKTDAKADSAAPKDDAKTPKDDVKTDAAAAPKDEAQAPKADAKTDAKAVQTAKDDAKADSPAPEAPQLSMLAADKQELKDAAMTAVDVKPKLKESYDDEDEQHKEQHIPEAAVAKQPVIKPEIEKDDEPMAKMPNEAPFQNKENDEDPMDKADPDPFKQGGTFTPEMEEYERQIKWEDENPVKQNGEIRPWDDLNDFQDPKAKVERAKKIADDIFEMTSRKVASQQQRMTTKQNVRDIKTSYYKNINFMKRLRKAIKHEDRQDKKEARAFDKRMRKLASGKVDQKKAAYANLVSKMEKEDEGATKDPEKPAQWALDEVTKQGTAGGSIFDKRSRLGRRL